MWYSLPLRVFDWAQRLGPWPLAPTTEIKRRGSKTLACPLVREDSTDERGLGGAFRERWNRRKEEEALCHSMWSRTPARNYMRFLRNMQDMFVTLSILSFAVHTPWKLFVGSRNPFLAFFFSKYATDMNVWGNVQLFGLSLLCVHTFIMGVVIALFIQRLRMVRQGPATLPSEHQARLSRTLWLWRIPNMDAQKWTPFKLDKLDFHRVEGDLKSALDRDISSSMGDRIVHVPEARLEVQPPVNRRPTLARAQSQYVGSTVDHQMGFVESIHVIPEIGPQQSVMLDLRDVKERVAAYEALFEKFQRQVEQKLDQRWRWFSWSFLKYHWFKRQLSTAQRKAEELDVACTQLASDPQAVTGSAFVTFTDEACLQHLLDRRRRDCLWRYAYFSFGRPPFASVTLCITKAPHPSDLVWKNLSSTQLSRSFRIVVGTVISVSIFLILDVVVTLTNGSVSVVVADVDEFRQFLLLHGWTRVAAIFDPGRVSSILEQEVPTVLLLLINSVVVPLLVAEVAARSQRKLRSRQEKVEWSFNKYFMYMNTLLPPLLGIASAGMFIKYVSRHNYSFFSDFHLEVALVNSGVFWCKYVLTCTFVSSVVQLTQVPQLLYHFVASRLALTDRDQREALMPYDWYYGYWYAWTENLLTLCLVGGMFFPVLLPLGALFFFVRRKVDYCVLDRGLFAQGSENEHVLLAAMLTWMETVICLMYLMIGSYAIYKTSDQEKFRDDGGVTTVRIFGWFLVALSILIYLFVQVHGWFAHRASRFGDATMSDNLSRHFPRFFNWFQYRAVTVFGEYTFETNEMQNVHTEELSWDPAKMLKRMRGCTPDNADSTKSLGVTFANGDQDVERQPT